MTDDDKTPVAAALRARSYEVASGDFGGSAGQPVMFRQYLSVLLRRHPHMTVTLSGAKAALLALSLIPGMPVGVSQDTIEVRQEAREKPGSVRLSFKRRT